MTPQQRFDSAVVVVLKHEGGYTNDKDDPGGATDYGISLRFLKDHGIDLNGDGEVNEMDIKALDIDKAIAIYKQYWWDKYHYEAINSLYYATKVFDMAVNMGGSQAHKLVQRACNQCGHNLVVDGILGGKSLGAINEIYLHNRGEDLEYETRDEQKWFYEHLAEEKPKFKKYLKGWLRRASW
jgi:lysozyme family protein